MNFLITFGSTRAFLDPIRYLSNRSSGLMGWSLIQVVKRNGNNNLFVVQGHSQHEVIEQPVVSTNQEMLKEIKINLRQNHIDVIILCAACVDFKFKTSWPKQKINKQKAIFDVTLDIDVAAALIPEHRKKQVWVGFACQNNFNLSAARAKLRAKKLNMIIINKWQAINQPTSQITILADNNQTWTSDCLPKAQIAKIIIASIKTYHDQKQKNNCANCLRNHR